MRAGNPAAVTQGTLPPRALPRSCLKSEEKKGPCRRKELCDRSSCWVRCCFAPVLCSLQDNPLRALPRRSRIRPAQPPRPNRRKPLSSVVGTSAVADATIGVTTKRLDPRGTTKRIGEPGSPPIHHFAFGFRSVLTCRMRALPEARTAKAVCVKLCFALSPVESSSPSKT